MLAASLSHDLGFILSRYCNKPVFWLAEIQKDTEKFLVGKDARDFSWACYVVGASLTRQYKYSENATKQAKLTPNKIHHLF